MYNIALTMKLRPGCYDKYKQAHDDLWPQIAKSMSDNQVSMAIYRLGDILFLHAAAPTQAHWQASREHPKLDQWHEEMAKLLETDPQGNIAFEELPQAFVFGLFKSTNKSTNS